MQPYTCKSNGSSAAECSLSPYPNSDKFCSKNYDIVKAAEEATEAITDRHNKMQSNEKFGQMMAMHSKYVDYNMTAVNLKCKYNSAKDNAVSKSSQ